MNKKTVAIIVVTYNRLALLQEEIESLRNQTFTDHQIIVVNNGSTDGTLEWLKNQEDIITITQGNLGGAGGFNTGMRYAAENGYEYCWIMDDDVICDKDSLAHLVDSYKRFPDAGYICSKVVGLDGEPMNVPILDQRKGRTDYPYWYNESEDGLYRVKNATFVSVLFRISVIYELGLPYKEYFIWGDDWEYTERISEKYVSFLCVNSTVIHKRTIQKRVSIQNENNPFRLKCLVFSLRNMAYNAVKFGRTKKWKCCLSFIVKIIISLLLLKTKEANIQIKAFCKFVNFHPIVEYPDSTSRTK